MIKIDGDCRIRDAVRDSKIRKDFPSKPNQKLDSSAMTDRDLDGWRHHLYYGRHRVRRDFPRTTKDGVAEGFYFDSHMEPNTKERRQVLCGLNQNLRTAQRRVHGVARDLPQKSSSEEHQQQVGFDSRFDEIDSGLHFYTEEEDPFIGLYHKHGGLIYKFKRNLSVFDGFWHAEDLQTWIAAIDDFFEEVRPPERVKCKIVWAKMKGRSYYWWKQFQQDRKEHGKEEIVSWPRMKKLLLNKFLPSTCSMKVQSEANNSKRKGTTDSEIVSASEMICESDGHSKEKEEKHSMVVDFIPTTCLTKVPSENTVYVTEIENGQLACEVIQRTTNILEPENCEEESNDDDLEEMIVEEQLEKTIDLKPAACSTKDQWEPHISKEEKGNDSEVLGANISVEIVDDILDLEHQYSLNVVPKSLVRVSQPDEFIKAFIKETKKTLSAMQQTEPSTSDGHEKSELMSLAELCNMEMLGKVRTRKFDPGGISQDRLLWFRWQGLLDGKHTMCYMSSIELESRPYVIKAQSKVVENKFRVLRNYELRNLSMPMLFGTFSKGSYDFSLYAISKLDVVRSCHEYVDLLYSSFVFLFDLGGEFRPARTRRIESMAEVMFNLPPSLFMRPRNVKYRVIASVIATLKAVWEAFMFWSRLRRWIFASTLMSHPLKLSVVSSLNYGTLVSLDAIVLWVLYRPMDYCLVSRLKSTREPMIWICNRNCWYTNWGRKILHRPVEDLAFAATRCFQLNELEDLHSHNEEGISVVVLNDVHAFFLITPLLLKCCLTKVCVVRMNALLNPIAVLSFMFDPGGKCGDDIFRLNAWSLARDNYYIYNGLRAHMEIKPLALAISTFDIGMVLQVLPYRKHEGNLENEVSHEHSLPRIAPLENKVDVVICVTGKAHIYVLSGSKGLADSRPRGGWIIKCVKGKSLKLELSGWEHKRMIQCELLVCAYDSEIAILLSDTLCMMFDPGGNLRNRTKSKGSLDLTLESGGAGTMDDPILVAINVHIVHLVDCSDPVYGIGIVWLVSASTMDITLQSFSIYSKLCIGFRDSATMLDFSMLQVVLSGLQARPHSSQSCGLKLCSHHDLNICSKNETSTEFFLVKLSHLGVCTRSKSVHEDCEFLGQPDVLLQLVGVLISDFLFVWDGQYIDDSGTSFSFYLTHGRVNLSEGWNDRVNGNTERRRLAVTKLSVFTFCVIILCSNEDFMKTLKVFYKLVNGLDPPKRYIGESGDVFAALDSSSYWIHACGQAFQVGGWR